MNTQAETGRPDPWRWYCRLCGERGEAPTPEQRDALASEHLAQSACGSGANVGNAESGRLLHVWTWGPMRLPAADSPELHGGLAWTSDEDIQRGQALLRENHPEVWDAWVKWCREQDEATE